MKKFFGAIAAASMIMMTISVGSGVASGAAVTGNGAQPGAHYTLNIIGTSDKSPDMTGDSGHRIFVPLDDATKIKLSPGDFEVLDANGTDGEAAFQLPAPAGGTAYTVYIRPLGTPGGSAHILTCAEAFTLAGFKVVNFKKSSIDPDAYCSLDSVGTDILTRTKGRQQFVDVTDELTTIRVEIQELDADGNPTGDLIEIDVDLFSDEFEGYFWEYDNSGLRISQLRFYPN